MNFAEVMATNPPRMIVLYQRAHDGGDQFQWGVVGQIPILTLIGRIIQVQSDITNQRWMAGCNNEPAALAITWDVAERSMQHFLSPDIPREPLVGMLETIKAMLVGSRVGQHMAAQKVQPPILGPDGRPMRH